MKKFLLLLGVLAGLAFPVRASTIVYTGYLANEYAGSTTTYTLDLKTDGVNRRNIDSVSATLVLSSASLSPITWTDGRLSTGSFTVSSLTNLLGATSTNTITVSSINLKNAWIKVNGRKFREGYDFKRKSTTALTAANIANLLNHIAGMEAQAVGSVVYATATTAGTTGNAFTLTTSTTALTAGGATFSGGLDPAALIVGDKTLTLGVDVATTTIDTTTGTAQAFVTAINADPDLLNLVTATRSGSTVLVTANACGVNDYATSSNFSGIVAISTGLAGGLAPSYEAGGHDITAVAHGLTTGVPGLYTSTVTLTGLATGTTYYAIKADVDTFELAATSTGAAAGTYIVLASSSTAGPHTFTLTPTNTEGTWGGYWQVSDDDTNWTNVSASTVTFATPYTQSTTAWDLGVIGHRYLRFYVVGGSGGSIKVQLYLTGKNSI